MDRYSNSSDGLHNMVTGLTLQSPISSPPPGRRIDTNASADVPPKFTPTMEQATLQSQPTQFNTPNRSIFSSGPPTSSVSVNTAQASIAGASSTSAPLTFFRFTGAPSEMSTTLMPSIRDRQDGRDSEVTTPQSPTAAAENELHEPAPTMQHTASSSPPAPTTPVASRIPLRASNSSSGKKVQYHRVTETAPLRDHLYTQGFRHGRHSDITVHAFSTSYPLHRLLLDRSPFFSAALSEPWLESDAKEITLHPEEVDPNISRKAFELALSRLYGFSNHAEEKEVAASLLATGCWLEMPDLIDISVEHLVRQMCTENVSQLIEMMSNNYYGKAGRQILLAAKIMLSREGWEMPLKYWDGISSHIIREIVGGDAFFVPGEWERWVLIKNILNRRLRTKLAERGLKEKSRRVNASRNHASHEATYCFDSHRNLSLHNEDIDLLAAIYSSPQIYELTQLLEHDVYYTHMTFEQLQYIQSQVDILGQHIVPTETVTKALWMSMELRQKVLNASETHLSLSLKHVGSETSQASKKAATVAERSTTPNEMSGTSRDSDTVPQGSDTQRITGSRAAALDTSHRNRRFSIPIEDSTRVVGHKLEAGTTEDKSQIPAGVSAPSSIRDQLLEHTGALDYSEMLTSPSELTSGDTVFSRYSYFPPYRFAVEFPNPLQMIAKERLYSRIIWYAGGMWNVYVQKLHTNGRIQIGVYLHRVRVRSQDGELSHGIDGAPRPSVDGAIGNPESEMLMPRPEKRCLRSRSRIQGDVDNKHGFRPGRTECGRRIPVEVPIEAAIGFKAIPRPVAGDDERDDREYDQVEEALRKMTSNVPALPPYVDKRVDIATYFKIYEMGPHGRTLKEHKSTPDTFSFSQSWGWKSIIHESEYEVTPGHEGSSKDGRLRYTIVLGNV